MSDMTADLLEGSIAFPIDENREEIDTDQALPADDLLNLQVIQISLMRTDLKTVGMGRNKRALCNFAKIPEAHRI